MSTNVISFMFSEVVNIKGPLFFISCRCVAANQVGEIAWFTNKPQRDFQQCGILTSVDSDEPVQPPFKIRNSKGCSVGSLRVIEYSSAKQRL